MFDHDSQHLQMAQQVGRISLEYASARVLQISVKVGVFEKLSQSPGMTTATLADMLQLDAKMLEKVLIACGALGWLDRDGDGWALTEIARVTLSPDSPLYQGNIIKHTIGVWHSWNDLEYRLRGKVGCSVFTEGAERDRDHQSFILGMRDLAMAGRAAEVIEQVDLGGCELLIDIGGGPATYSIGFCNKYPKLRVQLFDLPETLAIAKPLIEQAGLADRITLVEGNWNDDPFGQDADAVFMSQILHGPDDQTEQKLAKAHAALKPGGQLIVQDFLLNAEKTGPVWPALFNVMVGAWSQPELHEQITSAGFEVADAIAFEKYIDATLIQARKK